MDVEYNMLQLSHILMADTVKSLGTKLKLLLSLAPIDVFLVSI